MIAKRKRKGFQKGAKNPNSAAYQREQRQPPRDPSTGDARASCVDTSTRSIATTGSSSTNSTANATKSTKSKSKRERPSSSLPPCRKSKRKSNPSQMLTPPTSTSNHDAVAVAMEQIPRRLLKASDDKEDAFNHDVSSLLHLKEYDRTRFENLDFTRCNDDVIREVLPSSHNKSTTTFPYRCRSSLYLIRKHVRGEMSNNLLSLETKEFAHEYRPTPYCINLTKMEMKRYAKNWGDRENNGFENLVREAAFNYAKNIDSAPTTLSIYNKNTKRVFCYVRRVSNIKNLRKDYDNYAFVSPSCGSKGTKSESSGLCSDCESFRDVLMRKIRLKSPRTDGNNQQVVHPNHRNDYLEQSTPSKLMIKSIHQTTQIKSLQTNLHNVKA